MRHHRSLSGTWQFQIDPTGSATLDSLQPDREIAVPMPWQAALPELERYSGYAWYRRTFQLDETWLAGEVLLQFGAVDYWCQVFLNGRLAGEHEGGYTPFTIPIRSLAQAGQNDLVVRVYDAAQTGISIPRWPGHPPDAGAAGPPFDPNHVPHGKQEWYIDVGGIWQDVTLTAVAATYIRQVHVTPNIHTGTAQLTVELQGTCGESDGGIIRAGATDATLEAAGGEVTIALEPGQVSYTLTLAVAAPRLWSPDDPHLYTATVRLETAAGAEQVAIRFGFREISTRDGRILLNGEPIFLLAALDQDLYPDTIYTLPSTEFLRDEFSKARALGLNCLRCHIKPPDPRYLDLADEMGLLIWAEIPSWRTFYSKGTVHRNELNLDPAIKARAERTLAEMIARDYNHPALIIWTLVNEDWGTALPLSPADRLWTRDMYQRCKALDPTRLVVDNSPCPHPWGPNFHLQSDLDDFHLYANIPDHAVGFAESIEQLSLRPLWTFSNHGDARRTGEEPLILSEFGNWGLPSLRSLQAHYGGDPPWFDLGPWWSSWDGEAGWPFGLVERFAQLGLGAIWRDYEEFAEATQWHQFAALKFEIETMRRQQALAGYVITEFTDAYWEANGLLDFVRRPKVYHDRFAWVNAADVLIPAVDRYAYWDDQPVVVAFHGAHYSAANWDGARLSWNIGGVHSDDEVPVADLRRGTARLLGSLSFRLPQVEHAQMVELQFLLRAPDGAILARNSLDLLVLPAAARRPHYTEPVAVVLTDDRPVMTTLGTPNPGGARVEPEAAIPDMLSTDEASGSSLENSLRDLGYRTTRRLSERTRVAVTNYPTARLLHWVREGGDLLYLSRSPNAFFWFQIRGGAYSGSWMTSFSWLRPEIYRRLKVTNPLTMPFLHIMPGATILGLPVEDPAMQGDFLAGMVSGWVRHPAVHTVQFRYGRGRVIMTTFALEHGLRDHPAATAMFHDLLDHLVSDACRPTLVANY